MEHIKVNMMLGHKVTVLVHQKLGAQVPLLSEKSGGGFGVVVL